MTCCDNDNFPSNMDELKEYLSTQGGGFLTFGPTAQSVMYRPTSFPPWNSTSGFEIYGTNASFYRASVYTPNYSNML